MSLQFAAVGPHEAPPPRRRAAWARGSVGKALPVLVLVLVLVLMVMASGCASVRGSAASATASASAGTAAQAAADDEGLSPSRSDPWERFNRRIFAFNEGLDRIALKPLAETYQAVVPRWLRTGVDHMFGNLGDVWSAVNLVLQGKPARALDTGLRVGMNTFFGLAGFFDVAEEAGLSRESTEDFGQTLGVWGLSPGPYLMLPLLGPSTVRDLTGFALEQRVSINDAIWSESTDRNAVQVLRLVNTRARLLSAGQVLDGIALDKYVLVRDAYLARRRSLIYDGNPPDEEAAPPPRAPRRTGTGGG